MKKKIIETARGRELTRRDFVGAQPHRQQGRVLGELCPERDVGVGPCSEQ